MLVFISVIGIAFVPVVNAANVGSSSSYRVSNATPEQLEKINALWGTDITVGDYMEQVHPEHLVGVSDDVKKIMHERKMIWPDGKNETKIAQMSKLTASLSVTCTITKVSSTQINYRGTSTLSSGQATYIYNEAFLWNAAGTKVDSTSASTQAANSVSTQTKMYFWPASGNYHVTSYGYTISPNLEGTGQTGTISIP